ncbi:MAG: hypothetical protein HZC36_16325 [Armatimonadetes bacterium]|nr:hypothetical protein [Armatimonadota bacterium]
MIKAMRIPSRRIWGAVLAAGSILLLAGCSGTKERDPGKEPASGGPDAAAGGEPKAWPGVPPAKGKDPEPKPLVPGMPGPTAPMGKVTIPESASKGWKPSAMAPKELARKVSGAIASLTDTQCTARVFIKTPAGQARAGAIHKIQDGKHFRLDYFNPKGLPENARGFILANGTQKRQITLKGDPKVVELNRPFADSKLKPSEIVQRWPLDFSRIMLLSLTDNVDPWSPLIEGLAKGEGGYKTSIEQRTMQYQGRTVNSYRVLAKRTDSQAKKLGACELEMVIDARRFLPVTIRVKSKDKAGKDWDQQWSAIWDFKKKFVKKDFEAIQ